MLGLLSLPYEVLSNIVAHISFDDVFNLGQTCRDFQFLLMEESIAKIVVQSKIPFSQEAILAKKQASSYAQALRQASKRRLALSTAHPFIVSTIGFCDAYHYSKGMLCYTLDDKIRILDLHRSESSEMVISIPRLLRHALSDIGQTKGVFQILYYSDGVISCLYKSSDPEFTAWLISFHLRTRVVLVAYELESTDKIFVRHNKHFLYFGTHSELGADGYKKWVIHGYEFAKRKWFPEKVHFPDLVGSEIGSTICFELYDGFFYALSNQTSFEVEEIDWTSFYHCTRFPLNSPCKALLEKTENTSMWRRQHQEGPIDDRWTNLRLFEDESTGFLRIIETRKEWYLGSSKSQRTYYSTDIIFPKLAKDDEDVEMAYSQEVSTTNNDNYSTAASSSLSGSGSSSLSSAASGSTSTAPTTSYDTDYSHTSYPDPQLARLIDSKEDHPHYFDAFARSPHDTHPGSDGPAALTGRTHTLSKSRIRTYFTSCSTFMDLIDDPLPSDWTGTQRLRLRAGTRSLGPSLRDGCGLLRPPPEDVDQALQVMFRVPEVAYWPPEQDGDEKVDSIYRLMNPPSHLGDVEGTADERGLVYVTGGSGHPRALIYVGFDPGVKLEGVKRWGGSVGGDVVESDGEGKGKGKGKGKEVVRERGLSSDCAPVGSGGHAVVEVCERESERHREGRGKWAWKERAMYRDIGLGFYFGLDPIKETGKGNADILPTECC